LSKLIVAIPAYNETQSLPRVIEKIRKTISNEKDYLILVVDDGSTDKTSDAAISACADIVVRHERNLGIACAYKTAINVAIQFGAEIICTIDADGQFNPREIEQVVEPIINGTADLVIGSRFINRRIARSVPIINRVANMIVSLLVSMLIGKRIHDSESGFRALSRDAALVLTLLGKISFSSDMILDLSRRGLTIIETPVSVKYFKFRMSRVIKGFLSYGFKSLCLLILKKISFHIPLKSMADYYPPIKIIHTPECNLKI